MLRSFVCFGIEIDFRLPVYELVTADALSIALQLSVTAVEDQIGWPFSFKSDAIDGTLMRRGEVYIYIIIVQIYLVTIRIDLLMVIAVIDNRLQSGFFSLIRAQIKSRTSAVAGYDNRQSAQHITCKVGTLRIDTEHTVR